jgi:hypothetical protein
MKTPLVTLLRLENPKPLMAWKAVGRCDADARSQGRGRLRGKIAILL